ncbi:MAG TPA: hypothetical protein ENO22_07385 [candidate division Zixibacteria bacterium]|nr:hypothetical protein [candidate division Zixibacteria bacterium]
MKKLEKEIDNLIDRIAGNGDPTGRINKKLVEKERRISELKDKWALRDAVKHLPKIDFDRKLIAGKLSELQRVLKKDVGATRIGLKRFIDQFELEPLVRSGNKCYRARAKIKLQGLLGVTPETATLKNSGGWI